EVLPRDFPKPRVHRQLGRITTPAGWRRLEAFDVVVATPHTISKGVDESIVEAPEDLFDLVLFDEAHHSRAPSWTQLVNRFRRSRIVLLTATPFRLDRRRLPGKLIYHYPVGRALEAGIYREIVYHPVPAPSPEAADPALCERACELLRHERKTSPDARLLIRTASVKGVASLKALYEARGVRVREVHYKKSMHENAEALGELRRGRLDGVVCVGMLGEGLDIPELKVAALHTPPKSFPFTLQFIGRVSRPARGQSGPAHVVANPEQVATPRTSRELRRLYHEDASWRRLIPDLVAEVVGPLTGGARSAPASSKLPDDLQPEDITPFFSARVARVEPGKLHLDAPVELGDDVDIHEIPPVSASFRGFVTARELAPPWAARLDLLSTVYDLHLFYYDKASEILFSSTTSEEVFNEIEKLFIEEEDTEPVDGAELSALLEAPFPLCYPMLGFANTLGRTPALPTYKMMMGRDVQAAVGPGDSAAFALGHGLARSEPEPGEKPWTRGVGVATGKVWSMRREPLIAWLRWCEQNARELLASRAGTAAEPGALPDVTRPRRVRKFEDRPAAVLFSPFWSDFQIQLVRDGGAEVVEMVEPRMEGLGLDRDGRRIDVALRPAEDAPAVRLRYDLDKDRWGVIDPGVYSAAKIYRDGLLEGQVPLPKLLRRLPPYFYLTNGVLIHGGQLFQAKPGYAHLPAACFVPNLDWSECDVALEYEQPDHKDGPKLAAAGKKSVHDWLEGRLARQASKNAVILKDHASGEIADFVVFEPRDAKVWFYHCKSGDGGRPKAGMDQVRGVLDQVLRSVLWIKSPALLAEVRGRGDGTKSRPASRFVVGGDRFAYLETVFQPSRWGFEVVVVQPGLDGLAAVETANTNLLLVSCLAWLRSVGAELSLWCVYATAGKRKGPRRAAARPTTAAARSAPRKPASA
ncbi:MAG: DEAD/DEAH box helicase, partial [Thermoanaerobaculia bacterium]